MPDDLNHQQISTVQSNLQPGPVTIASAATIAPTTFISFISGAVSIKTITPPVTGQHLLAFIFTTAAPAVFLTTGNLLITTTTLITNVPVLLLYDPLSAKYYPLLGK